MHVYVPVHFLSVSLSIYQARNESKELRLKTEVQFAYSLVPGFSCSQQDTEVEKCKPKNGSGASFLTCIVTAMVYIPLCMCCVNNEEVLLL